MKILRKIVTLVILLNIGNVAIADDVCPDTLSADEMYDCIVVEGAGGTYLDEKEMELVQDKIDAEEIAAANDAGEEKVTAVINEKNNKSKL